MHPIFRLTLQDVFDYASAVVAITHLPPKSIQNPRVGYPPPCGFFLSSVLLFSHEPIRPVQLCSPRFSTWRVPPHPSSLSHT